MELSILIAKILSLTYFSAGVAVFSKKLSFAKISEDFEKSPGLTFLGGFIALAIGATLVEYHNRWSTDWTVLVTLVGWISLLKGVLFIAFPGFISPFKKWTVNPIFLGPALFALGALFGYFGFIR